MLASATTEARPLQPFGRPQTSDSQLTLVLPPASLQSSEPSSCCRWTMDLRHSLWLSKAGLVVSSIQFNRELHQDLGSKGRKRPRSRYARRRQRGGDLHTEQSRLGPAAAYRCGGFHAQNSDEGTSGCLRKQKFTWLKSRA